MSPLYQSDLAHIHHSGYSGPIEAIGPELIALLRHGGIDHGHVIDLGCGGGVLLKTLFQAGYQATGVDQSAAFVEMAQAHAPGATVVLGTVDAVDLPRCHGITAIGEVLSYLPADAMITVLENSAAKLEPGGMLLFDILVEGEPMGYKTWQSGEDWLVAVSVTETPPVVTRDIVAFRRQPDGLYRHSAEQHRLQVFNPDWIKNQLETLGFQVRTASTYGSYALPPRRLAFIAQKPTR